MPGLMRGIARTAVVAGTATAVSGRVQRRQAERYADRDAQIYADRQQAYDQAVAPPPQPAPQYASSAGTEDTLAQLRELGELRAQGILTEEEFAIQKARILA